MSQDLINEITFLLEELEGDECVSNNTKGKLNKAISTMKEEIDSSIKASKVLYELEGLSENTNLDSQVRTQVWNVVSLLETL